MAADLPCDPDGVCMVCKKKVPEEESIVCSTCATPWHAPCLSRPPESLSSIASWECPDCAAPASAPVALDLSAHRTPPAGAASGLVAAIRAIESDAGLTEREKARKRQELLSGGAPGLGGEDQDDDVKRRKSADSDVLDLLDEKFKCSICMQLPERPVTTPCGHNFCLKCFQKWVGQGKYTCAKCRSRIPQSMVSHPRINSALVIAIRTAKTSKMSASDTQAPILHYIRNEDKPEEAYRTERAKKAGKANACCGQIFVTIPPDHFGPITKEYDPKHGEGVYVGRTWDDRMECRQWGAHFPHVAGIAGQSDYGAQSVALSGGYKDDEDHGEWFLYTGSGGRDLSGNKRTNKEQSFDQKFEKLNEALRVSCLKGYPVRVVRSHKEKRSSYAPEKGVRYDGIYRIEMCWCKVGIQGFKVCRYLFVRCDNDPAPWTSDTYGDLPRPLPKIPELKKATDVTKREQSPAWDYDEQDGWKWTKPPPPSRKLLVASDPEVRQQVKRAMKCAQSSVRERLLKEFSCLICRNVMKLPLTTPCAHNFCKSCLLGSFDDLSAVKARTSGGRTLRAQRIVRKCPCCPYDISDFLQNPQVNREMMDLIESLQRKDEQERVDRLMEDRNDVAQKSGAEDSNDAGWKLSEERSDRVEKHSPTDVGIVDMDSPTSEDRGVEMKMSNGKDGVENKNAKPMISESGMDPFNSEGDTYCRITETGTDGHEETFEELAKKDKSAEQNGNLAEHSNEFSDTKEKRVESVEGDSQSNVYEEGFVKEDQTPESKKDFMPSCKRRIDGGTESGSLTMSKKSKVASDDKDPPSRPLTRSQESLVQ